MKRCPTCREAKDAHSFGVDRTKKDGLQSWCKRCRTKANNARTAQRVREDEEYRKRTNARKESQPSRKRYRRRNKEQARIKGTPAWARLLVERAVSGGKLNKPDACVRCRDTPPRHRLHGHHWHGDYAGRPLEVEWLCSLCHGAEHSRSGDERQAEGAAP